MSSLGFYVHEGVPDIFLDKDVETSTFVRMDLVRKKIEEKAKAADRKPKSGQKERQ